jgi:hypothetical protein
MSFGNGFSADDLSLGNRAVTGFAANACFAMVDFVREPDKLGNLVDLDPTDRFLRLVVFSQLLNGGTVVLDTGMALHAAVFVRISGSKTGFFQGMALQALQTKLTVKFVTEGDRLLLRRFIGGLVSVGILRGHDHP